MVSKECRDCESANIYVCADKSKRCSCNNPKRVSYPSNNNPKKQIKNCPFKTVKAV